MRIIMTGVTNDGETRVITDDDAMRLGPKLRAPPAEFTHILGCDDVASLPSDGKDFSYGPAFFPAPGGFRFWLLTMPGHSEAPPANSGTAYANTIEWVIVLDGEIEHVLPNGIRFALKPGDSIVQIGAQHRWENKLDATCRMAVAAIGATAETPSPWIGMPAKANS